MRTQSTETTRLASPLWDLLSTAEEVQVREIATRDDRAFVVRVRSPRPAEPAEALDRDHLLECAATLLGSGDTRLARTLYSFLLKQRPEDAYALRGLGLCLLAGGDAGGAKRCFRALPADDDGERHFLLGRCFAEEGDDAAALEELQKVGRPERLATPVAAAVWRETGDCLLRLGRFEEAARCFDRAFPLVNDAVPIHVSYGWLEYRRDSLAAAETYFRRAIGLNPECSRARAGLGLVAFARRDNATAARELYRAFATDPHECKALAPLLPLAEGRRPDGAARRTLTAALERAKRTFYDRR